MSRPGRISPPPPRAIAIGLAGGPKTILNTVYVGFPAQLGLRWIRGTVAFHFFVNRDLRIALPHHVWISESLSDYIQSDL